MDTRLSNDLKTILHAAAGFFLAAAIFLLASGCVALDIRIFGNANENGIIEMTQLALLEFTAAGYFVNAWRVPSSRIALAFFGLLAATAVIREMDGPLDVLLFHGSWKYIALAPWIAMAAWMARRFRDALAQMAAFVRTTPYKVFLAGAMTAAAFAQAVSYKGIWTNLIPGVDLEGMRPVKNYVQESFELLAYLILAYSAVLQDARRPKKAEGSRPGQGKE